MDAGSLDFLFGPAGGSRERLEHAGGTTARCGASLRIHAGPPLEATNDSCRADVHKRFVVPMSGPEQAAVSVQQTIAYQFARLSGPVCSQTAHHSVRTEYPTEAYACASRSIRRPGPGFCLQDLINLNLHERAADVSEIVVLAQKEARIDKKLAEITSTWNKKTLEFSLEREDTPLLLPLDEVVEVLEQHSVDLMTMISQGAVIDFCRSSVEEWQLKLRTVDTVLTVWMEVQRKWEASLSPVLVNI